MWMSAKSGGFSWEFHCYEEVVTWFICAGKQGGTAADGA